ncbi:MAG: prenyltransferase [Coriobacteriia bacterium]|nr:prenyltransferase [Coriobacteriia bacterium]
MAETTAYGKLTPTMMVQLAAPHTWVAAVLPVLVGSAIAVSVVGRPDTLLMLLMLVICVLLQSAVNTLNDYMDFKKGADTLENQLDATDAVLVYNNVNPAHVFRLFLVFVGVAFVLGLYVVFRTSWICLVIGLVGILIIVLYSVGRTPLSYLPLGELASGITMGGLITLATAYVLTGVFDWMYLVEAIPLILGVGLINFTNNMCDIEKDIEANRKTVSVLMGRPRALKAYHGVVYAIILSICVLVLVFHLQGWPVLIFTLLTSYPLVKALVGNPLVLKTRGPAMSQVLCLNICLGAFYALCFLVP